MCYIWHDWSATRPINRVKRKCNFVLFTVIVQYHSSSSVHTTAVPVFKAFPSNRLNIKRDLWQHISPLDVITGVNFAPSAWRDCFSLLRKKKKKNEQMRHIFTLWKRLSAGAVLYRHNTLWGIFVLRVLRKKKKKILTAVGEFFS